ncbi:MAG: amino acid adenylation domain-containing protein [Flavobacteriales bacterium]|nr:amino acid adenylation domain-containing protein [Flavobacteriales bacterium]
MEATRSFDPYAVFASSVRTHPDRIALSIGLQEWTYAQLEEHASAIAGWCERYTPEGARIAVHGQKSLITYSAILGILRSGRSYVPLHPDHPPARWRTVIERSGAVACIAGWEVEELLRNEVHVTVPDSPLQEEHGAVRSGNEAYVMFTSGSTGGPKGVPISRANVAAYLSHFLTAYDYGPEARFSQIFALTFDLSVHDLFVCWGSGGCLCVPEQQGALTVASYVERQKITAWFSVPSHAALLRRMRSLRPGVFPRLRHSFFCGEALPWDVAKAWCEAAPNSNVVNLYGPTEATIAITAFDVRSAAGGIGTVPLGVPIGTNRTLVVPVADRDEGELLLSGPQVSSGYLEDAGSTEQAFVKIDGQPGIWYRTGDLVRKAEEGTLHFIGRSDDQVKVLGHRVEPGEVDSVLRALLPDVSILTLPMAESGTTRLVTFIDQELETSGLLEELRSELPPYMVPERILFVDTFPLTAHGKVDRKALIEMAKHG